MQFRRYAYAILDTIISVAPCKEYSQQEPQVSVENNNKKASATQRQRDAVIPRQEAHLRVSTSEG